MPQLRGNMWDTLTIILLIFLKFVQFEVFVDFFGWYEDERFIYLAMEHFPKGTLDKFLGPELREEECRIITSQLLEGLNIMHCEGFTHRDLKPSVSLSRSKLQINLTRH